LYAKHLGTTKKEIAELNKKSLGVKSHKDLPEDVLRELSKAMTEKALGD
jgi:hypothetical protein